MKSQLPSRTDLAHSVCMIGMVHWILTESAIDEVEIRRRLESARDRQFRELNFPTGVSTIEEMKKAWAKIDFGGRQSAQAMMDVIKELESQPECVSSF